MMSMIWKLAILLAHHRNYIFDGSVCDDGRRVGIGNVLISPSGAVFKLSNRLEEFCTNNQVEYEALLFGLEFLQSMGVKHVDAFGDHFWWCSKYPRYANVTMEF